MLNHEYVHEQLWKEREADWNARVRRGDFVKGSSKRITKLAKKQLPLAKSILRKIGML
ncbi:hypothetical protein [Paenibacillus nanensis]|uniref:hypothetical protein n=1 Tax=Paenibacillus nanensis TaxID=393251 RepID=UPI0013C2B945|nr:hypothetical protein [Paenibacillus nanensis]